MLKISVVLTSYNKPHTVGKAIESVLNQTYGNWELFVMDDNSNKETVQVINRYVADTRISYFNSYINNSERYKTTRYATLINEAIPKTTGEFITYITDDNQFYPDRFKTMIDFFVQNPDTDIVYSQQLIKWFDEHGRIKNEIIRRTKGILTNAAEKVDHCSIMHTRRIAEKVNKEYGSYWDDDPAYWFYGDAAFWKRLARFAQFYPIPQTLDIALKYNDSFQILFTYLPNIIPNGTLIKGPSTPIYIIDNQMRKEISVEVFHQLNYSHNKVVNVPDPFVYKYNEDGKVDSEVFENISLMPNQRLIKSLDHPEIYFIQDNVKHKIINEKAFKDYHFESNQIVTVDDYALNQLSEGVPIEELSNQVTMLPDGVLFKQKSVFYLSMNNNLHQIDDLVAMKLNLPISNPILIDEYYLKKFPQGETFYWDISSMGK